MDISEAKRDLKQLESDLRELLHAFQNKTRLAVTAIHLERVDQPLTIEKSAAWQRVVVDVRL